MQPKSDGFICSLSVVLSEQTASMTVLTLTGSCLLGANSASLDACRHVQIADFTVQVGKRFSQE